MGDGLEFDSRKTDVLNSTDPQFYTDHVEKAALTTSGLLFSANFGMFQQGWGKDMNIISTQSDATVSS